MKRCFIIIIAILFCWSAVNSSVKVQLPAWFGQLTDDDVVSGFGQAESPIFRSASSRATAFAMADAKASVDIFLNKITDVIIIEVANKNMELIEKIEAISKNISNQRFTSAKIHQSEVIDMDNGNFMAFIHYTIPKKEIISLYLNEIFYEENLYKFVKDTNSFKELEQKN